MRAPTPVRRCGDDECEIVVFSDAVGIVTRRSAIAGDDPGGVYHAAHPWNDVRGPKLVDDRREARPAIAAMPIERDLVPCAPPVRPAFAGRSQRAA